MRMPHRAGFSQPKARIVLSAVEAQGEQTRHEAEKLNPSENYCPPGGRLFPPFLDITLWTPLALFSLMLVHRRPVPKG